MFRAIMHYPKNKDSNKQRRLAAWFSTRPLVYEAKQSIMMGRYSSYDIELLDEARSFEDLGGKPDIMHRRGFFAAHWLRYRLYAAAHKPELGSTERWTAYVIENLLSELPQHWRTHFNTFEADRRAYAAAAHLWLANFDERNEGLRLTPRPRPDLTGFSRLNMFDGLYPDERRARVERLYSRAKAYFALGKAAGLYGNSRGQIRLDDVWTLSDQSKPATMQSPESPDLLVAEFDPDEFTRICKERRYRDGKDDGNHRPALSRQQRKRQPV